MFRRPQTQKHDVMEALFPPYPLTDCIRHRAEIDAAVASVLSGGHYILGRESTAFEEEFAAWAGVAHACGVANGTDAIELLLRALDIGPGDAVAVPSMTAVASVSAIVRAGAAPIFVDVDAEWGTMSPEALRLACEAGGGRVKAVLAVHLYGQVCDMDGLAAVADRAGAVLLEDAAQAHGASLRGRRTGGLARAAAFSFYPTKNLGAIGDGGAVTTDDAGLAERVRRLRQYGWRERYISEECGVNSRLDELQAAILRVKLRTLDEALASRRRLAARLGQALEGCAAVRPPAVRPGTEHAWHLYVVRSGQRDALLRHLEAAGIPVALHYPAAVHQQPAWLGQQAGELPETERMVREILTLPLHPWLTDAAIDAAATAVRDFSLP